MLQGASNSGDRLQQRKHVQISVMQNRKMLGANNPQSNYIYTYVFYIRIYTYVHIYIYMMMYIERANPCKSWVLPQSRNDGGGSVKAIFNNINIIIIIQINCPVSHSLISCAHSSCSPSAVLFTVDAQGPYGAQM